MKKDILSGWIKTSRGFFIDRYACPCGFQKEEISPEMEFNENVSKCVGPEISCDNCKKHKMVVFDRHWDALMQDPRSGKMVRARQVPAPIGE